MKRRAKTILATLALAAVVFIFGEPGETIPRACGFLTDLLK